MFTILDKQSNVAGTAETVAAAQRLVDHHFRTDREHAPFRYVPTASLCVTATPEPRKPLLDRICDWFNA